VSKRTDPGTIVAINASDRTIKAGELVSFVGMFTHPDDGTKTPCVEPLSDGIPVGIQDGDGNVIRRGSFHFRPKE
jgi:hypothetical protein